MAEYINWIHFSDLHFGLDDRSWLWPRSKRDLFRDLERLSSRVDGWDLVFFTGDFVQSGSANEYDKLNFELEALWKILTINSRQPKLCAVPGNHDLVRPPADGPIAKTLSKLWGTDPGLRKTYWSEPGCDYRAATKTHFSNYTSWLENIAIPQLPVTRGILPGDFSSTFVKGDTRLGIVGLNTTFLQIVGGDMKGQLDIHVSQLNAVCDGDADAWLMQRTASLLLTHQPLSWLTPEGVAHFRQEIYPPGRFLAHLSGHQHEPEAYEISEAGAAPRRFRQGPSLFGLEEWDGPTPNKRIHGYNSGQFIFEPNCVYEKLWPRVAVKGRHGGLNLSPDFSYQLGEDESISTTIELSSQQSAADVENSVPITRPDGSSQQAEQQLLESEPTLEEAKRGLAGCLRLPLTVAAQNRYVRIDEQSECEHALRRSRVVWINEDWGSGKEAFIATVIERLKTQSVKPEAFHLKCDEVSDIDGFEALFPQQFGLQMQHFCRLAATLESISLVLDGLSSDLCKGPTFDALQRIVAAILDYCPNIRIVLVSRSTPPINTYSSITLKALDAPDVRAYVVNHPDGYAELNDARIIEQLHEASEGLPMALDRMLKALKVTSLPAVLEAELEGAVLSSNEEAPPSVVSSVSKLAKSEDRRSRRSIRLLKVLSILPYGETLDSISHYLPTEPFFLENAIQLTDAGLLDVIPLQRVNLPMSGERAFATDFDAVKLLKIPRQVREYTQTILTDEEKFDLVLAGLERLFGREWREGKVRLRNLPSEYREYLASGAGNEFALIHHLISHARSNSDDLMIRRGAALGIRYANHLKAVDRYRDLTIVAGALVQLIDRYEFPGEWARLAALYGEGLRMSGAERESLEFSKGALVLEATGLNDAERASTWLDVALAEEDLENTDEAIAAAEMVKKYSKDGSGPYLHALTIIAENTLFGDAKTKALVDLENRARSKNYTTLADTIALVFAREAKTTAAKIRHLDKVLDTKDLGYNQMRAIVSKAKAIANDDSRQLQASDLVSLTRAYSYLHAQRFSSTFDQCHEELWRIFESKGDSAQLFRLFRHSSFIWRIRGEEQKEADYLKRLQRVHSENSQSTGKGLLVEVAYFLRRVKLVIRDVLGA